ncbi:MAG: DedA family protein [Thermoplasmata archaeon]|nr:DedA family protein [Thermoplasmata archaeon]
MLTTVGLPGLFALMLVESVGVPPLPSEVILPFAGVLIVRGTPGFTWPTVLAVAVAGGVVGAILAYEAGRRGGRALIHRWGARAGIDEKVLRRSEEYFDRHGKVTVGTARLVPVLRAYISYPAGAAKMDRSAFVAFTTLGSLPFVAVLIYLGTVLGNNFTVLQHYFEYLDIVVVVAIGLLLLLLYLRWKRGRDHPDPTTHETGSEPADPAEPPR